MINRVHYSMQSDEWETPQVLFEKLNLIYHFDIDVAASKDNTKCKYYFSKEQDGLIKKWVGTCWCNPPYSKLKAWIKKAYEESLQGVTIVMLIPARTDTKAWHDYIFPNAKIEFLKGRLKFSNSKNSAPFPSAIVVFGMIKTEQFAGDFIKSQKEMPPEFEKSFKKHYKDLLAK